MPPKGSKKDAPSAAAVPPTPVAEPAKPVGKGGRGKVTGMFSIYS